MMIKIIQELLNKSKENRSNNTKVHLSLTELAEIINKNFEDYTNEELVNEIILNMNEMGYFYRIDEGWILRKDN